MIENVVSIGPACPSAHAIQSANLKQCSYPFDWLLSHPEMIIDCIKDDFKSFLDFSEYYHTKDRKCTQKNPYCHHRKYGKNVFHHHCPMLNPKHHSYFERCVERFRKIKDNPNNLYVYMNIYKKEDEDFQNKILELYEALKPCKILGLHCIEKNKKRQAIISYQNSDITIVNIYCKSKNTGLKCKNELDNEMIRSIFKWYA